MKKNYNLLPKSPHTLLWRLGGNETPNEGSSPPTYVKKSSLLLTAMLFMFATVQTFAQTTYCTPAPSSVDGIGITNVSIGSINNATVAETGNYGNYSAQIVNIGQGVVQPFVITFSTGFTYDTKIWVDWNNDFDFTDAGEEVYSGISTNANPTLLSGTITVPTTATLGNHRLRIGGQDNGPAVPCYTGTYGSFEDYTINVTLPPSCFTPANAAVTVTASNTANLSWAAPSLGTTPVGYEYYVDTNASVTGNAVATATTATSVTGYTGFADNTNYYLHVRTNCGSDSFSEWINSPVFRFIGGDTCLTAISLDALTSPMSSTTVGAANDFSPTCGFGSGPDLYYSIAVPVGYKLTIGQTANNYDAVHTLFYGTCATPTQIVCGDYPEIPTEGPAATIVWENTTGTAQTVFWVQDGNSAGGGTFTLAWSLTPPPACNVPTAVTAQLLSATQANLSWGVPVTGTAVGYQYAVTTTNTAPAASAITSTTATSVAGATVTPNVTNYLWVRTSCGTDAFSEWISIPFFAGYCIPAPTSVDGLGITNVTIGSINNTTVAETGNYANYTAQIVNVGQGVSQPFSITYSTGFTYATKIWIDWNDDLDFNDAGEEVYVGESTNANPTILSGSFTVPATATLGNHRMRIGGQDNGPAAPCYTGSYGSFEDYTINVTTPPSCFTPSSPAGVATASGLANLSWTAPSLGTTPTGYEYVVNTVATSPAEGVTGTGVTATSVTGYSGIVDGTVYYLHVRTNCGNGSYSDWVNSVGFRYLPGDTCATAIPLDDLTSPLSSTTVGASNDYTPTCGFSNAPDLLYSIQVPVGYKLSIGQTANNYDTLHSAFYGTCEERTVIACADYPELPADGAAATLLWENTTSATQTVYWVQDGYGAASGTFTLAWSLIPPPACNVPTAVTATLTATTTVDFNWAAPLTGTATGYEYAVTSSTDDPAASEITATTATSVTGVPVTLNFYNYLHVRSVCGDGLFSEWITVRYYSGYCIPAPTSVDGIGITNVTIGNINNTTVAEEGNYGNYALQSTNIGQGVEQAFSITFRTGYTYDTKIWVDWNDDLDFDDEGEQVYFATSTNANPTTLTGTFTVPANATLGNHRLRIGGLDSGGTDGVNVTPCYSESYGTFEDYTITVTTPPLCFVPTALSAVNAATGFVNIGWTAPTLGGTPAGYEYVIDTTQASPAAGVSGTATTETSVTNVAAPLNITGYLHVRTNCGDGGFSDWATVSFYNGVCIPAPSNVDGLGITNVSIGSINNTTVAEPGNYGNYSAQVVNVGQGVTQEFAITYRTGYTYDTKIWVDWNDDLDFDDEGEQVYVGISTNTNPTVLVGTFTVPVNATLGNHRLRIGGLDAGGVDGVNVVPCYIGSYASFEDYTINVTTPPSCFTPTNAVGVATASGLANLSWTAPTLGGTPTGYEYIVDTIPGAPAAGVSGTVTTATSVTGYTGILDNTYYYVHVRTVCGEGDASEWITSPRFRFLLGDTCITAINLDGLTSPIEFSTEGANDDFTPTCGFGSSPDLYYSVTVPNGYTLTIGLNDSDYSTATSVFYGNCTVNTALSCRTFSEENTVWENLTGSSQTVYWVQDGYNGATGSFELAWSMIPPVTCDVPRALNVQLTSLTTADISWNVPNTGSPEGYEYYISNTNTDPAEDVATFTTATSVTGVTVTPNVSQYLYVRSICSDEDGESVWVSIPFFSGYCVPTNVGSTAYYITGVTTTGGNTNISTSSSTFSAFTDYTATQSVSSYAGGTFAIQATTPNATDGYLYSVWVDWNNDFDFDDNGERVVNTGSLTSPATLGDVAVPVNTPVGTYRMRVRNAHIGSPVPACGEQGSGEAEDYTLIVEATPSCLPPYNVIITPTDPGYADLRWSPSELGGAPIGYEYVFGPSPTAPAEGVSGTPSTSFFVGSAEYDTTASVYLFVRSVCGAGDYSEWTAPVSILDFVSPELLSNSVVAYKDGNAINITSGTTQLTGVTIYDTRGRKLYTQTANSNNVVINDLQIQQQVIILEINTTKGTVSKRIIF